MAPLPLNAPPRASARAASVAQVVAMAVADTATTSEFVAALRMSALAKTLAYQSVLNPVQTMTMLPELKE